jgi:hypothetical protein
MMDIKDLAKPFPKDAVHWRVQGKPYQGKNGWAAMALAYIDARDVMDRLDEVCGPDGWQDSYVETASGRVICTLSIRTESGWVSKSDGAGGTAVEAEKGGISDALKRAAVKWGIGRYLYRLDSPWVACRVNEKRSNAWKEWAEDPWSKVKSVTYHEAEKSQVVRDDGDEVNEAKAYLDAAEDVADLGARWRSLPEHMKAREDMKAHGAAVKAKIQEAA